MERITYRDMEMTVIRSNYWEREPILDDSNTTYLYTRWRASVVVTYNPQTTSFVSPRPARNPGDGAAGNQPEGGPANRGYMPVETDRTIRAYLEQPRGELIVHAAGRRNAADAGGPVLVLHSPPLIYMENGVFKRAPCDAKNGPFLTVNTITQIPGERLWQISLEFETYVNETPTPKTIVSNRWHVFSDTNADHLTTRTYQGICTVRADMLRVDPANDPTSGIIDSLRAAFAGFTVPRGFQRTSVNVQVYPDGNSAYYRVVDTEQLWDKSADSPATRVEVQDTAWAWESPPARAGLMLPGVFAQTARGALNAGDAVLGAIAGAGAAVEAAAITAAANLPRYYKRCHVRCWGNKRTSRYTLVTLALAIAQRRVANPEGAALLDAGFNEIIVSGDTNNSVDVVYTKTWDYQAIGLIGSNIELGINLLVAGIPALTGTNAFKAAIIQHHSGYTADANIPNPQPPPPIGPLPERPVFRMNQRFDPTPTTPVNVPFPNARGTRGTFTGQLLTQVLEGFDTAPAGVP